MVNVNVWVADEPDPLPAMKVSTCVPPVPVAGVPARVAVPLPLSVKVTPVGSVPDSPSAGVGNPVALNVKVPAVPAVKVVEGADVMAGGWSTVRVKLWVAGEPTPLVAVMVMGYVPPVPLAGVPARVAVPLPLSVKVTPVGSVPDSPSDAAGNPVAVTVKVPADPVVNVVEAADDTAGAWSIANVNVWVADEPAPLLATMVTV
jgi:hypothetical protein